MSAPTSSRSTSQSLGALGVLIKLAVLALLASLLVVLPTPRVEAVETMVVDTRTPALAPAPANPPGRVIAMSVAGEDLAAELREPGRRIAAEEDRIQHVGGTFVPDLGRYTADGMDDIAWISPTSASYLWVAAGAATFRSVTLG